MGIEQKSSEEPKGYNEAGFLPYLDCPTYSCKLFDPEDYLGKNIYAASRSGTEFYLTPRVEDCELFWSKYDMLDNIQIHSSKVADFAVEMSLIAKSKGADIDVDLVRASGLLHDLGKTYSIKYGGDHAALGAAWVMNETRNAPLAMAVLFHVHWPWDNLLDNCFEKLHLFAVFAICYADKRVMHDTYVSLDQRFEDLQARYGKTAKIKEHIEASRIQGKRLEDSFYKSFGVDLNAYTIDNGRLVERA